MEGGRVSQLITDGNAAVDDDEGDENGGHDEVAANVDQWGQEEEEERLWVFQQVKGAFDDFPSLSVGVEAKFDRLKRKVSYCISLLQVIQSSLLKNLRVDLISTVNRTD